MHARFTFALAAFAAAMGAVTLGAQTPAGPSETNFRVATTGDLVRLCEAKPTDTNGVAALHFCHGFAVGAYQYHQVVTAAEKKRPLVCAPSPTPARNDVIADFVAWAKQNPKQLEAPPVEGMFRYLAQRFPCHA
ncbi:Rap1a/Tai family immunity protein [Azospirillum sp. TSO22-1]|uniref:Rap1a/Tai family immunity protein n=1 Tax=Azospirillum sp. TSO22-1 TaxID=716789 RepID=UPI000D64711B|nr:Rap1a/Tai family immunity protein [Azospirillum sp. TSO22-1]